MGVTDVEGNTGKKVPSRLNIVPSTVPPWLLQEHDGLGHGVTWEDCDADSFKATAVAITRAGAAFSISEGRDHRSVSVTILDGPERPKFYASSPTELDSLLRRLRGAA
jgi:hypothetical protein